MVWKEKEKKKRLEERSLVEGKVWQVKRWNELSSVMVSRRAVIIRLGSRIAALDPVVPLTEPLHDYIHLFSKRASNFLRNPAGKPLKRLLLNTERLTFNFQQITITKSRIEV